KTSALGTISCAISMSSCKRNRIAAVQEFAFLRSHSHRQHSRVSYKCSCKNFRRRKRTRGARSRLTNRNELAISQKQESSWLWIPIFSTCILLRCATLAILHQRDAFPKTE